jgi:lipopolysaccharide/colanic/teichoic acid biosynthesis glycosyltransferase/glycosyltransferase involved in cell wall biosynthesis
VRGAPFTVRDGQRCLVREMRILYIHQYFSTPEGTTGCRSYEFARRFVAAGHEVDLVTSDAMLPSSLKKERANYRFCIEGISVHVIRVRYENRMNVRERMRAFFSFGLKTCRAIGRLPKPDVVFATSTPLTVGIPGAYAAWFHRCPLVFEVRDLWPQVPIALGWLRNPLLKLLARGFERWVYRRSARLIALSPDMALGVARTGFHNSRIAVIPNCSDIGYYSSAWGDDEFRRRMGWSKERIVAVHPGTMGQVNGLGAVLDAARHLAKLAPEVLVALVGDGRERKEIESRIAKEQLGNVLVQNPVPKREMPRLLAASDIGLMTVLPLPALFANSANKFFDFLAAGLPIVINYGGWQAQLLRDYGCGVNAKPGDAEDLAATITLLANDDVLRLRMGRNARRLAEEHFSRDDLARQLLDVLEDVATGPSPRADCYSGHITTSSGRSRAGVISPGFPSGADMASTVSRIHGAVVYRGLRRKRDNATTGAAFGCTVDATGSVPRGSRSIVQARLNKRTAGSWQERLVGAGLRKAQAQTKRVVDVVGAALGVGAMSPLLAGIALLIRLSMGRPAFFRQARVGLNGRPFMLLKFRTMVKDAERMGARLNVGQDDPRITRLGRLLRKWSLDELPELVNVLRGEMSIVGPRATLQYQVGRYTPFQRRRLEVKPGITGWAQVNGRNALTWPERIEMDVWYVDHWSLWLDLKIILKTFGVLLRKEGIYEDRAAEDPFSDLDEPGSLKTDTQTTAKSQDQKSSPQLRHVRFISP